MPPEDQTTDSRPDLPSPPATAGEVPQRVYTLSELIEPATLSRLCRTFSNLCGAEIALYDAAGGRIDAPVADDTEGGDPGRLAERYSIPVTWKGHTLGRVVVLADEPAEHVRESAGLIADMLSGICRTEARIHQRVSELTMVYDLGGLFAGSEELGAILNIAAKRICQVMGVKAAAIRLLDEATGEMVISGVYNLSDAYLRKGRIVLSDNPIDAAAVGGEVVYIEDVRTDPRVRFREHARREGLISGLCSPMTYRGHTVGVLRIYTSKKQRFSGFDVELLRAVASQAAAAIVHCRLFEESVAAERYERHLKYAGQIQRRMIPRQSPKHERITFGQVYEPSLEVGGDFFDFLDLPGGNLGLAIADVVGKGLPGALMMASVRSALRAHAHGIFDINEIVAQVNRHLCRDTLASEFATLCYGVFSPEGSRFTYCNAGHNPPLLLRGGSFTPLDTGGSVIGVFPEAAFDKQVVELLPGDVFVFYTDGVTEAFDYDDNIYGIERFKQSILRYRDEPATTMANQLLWDVRRFAGLTRQADDITLVVAKIA